jgi:DNA-binding NtrC family response regulator
LTLAEAERRAIVRALRATSGAKQEAADLLRCSRRTLYNKIRAYGLE